MKIRHLLTILILMPSLCYAYVGPGMGFTVIASLMALGSAFFITLFNFIWQPIKHFFKRNKGKDDTDTADDEKQQQKDDQEEK